jgi:hypothetical protein
MPFGLPWRPEVSMADPASHRPLEQHDHVHDRFCGHAAVPHEDHVDFLHDGHVHHVHEDHVDDFDGVLASPPGGPDLHVAHTGHMHVHEDGCGHVAVAHEDHLDYVHGDHRHAGHHVHYDEH